MPTIQSLIAPAKQLIIETGAFIINEAGKVQDQEIETKSLNSLVSYVDKTAEEKLVEGLATILPEAVFLTEEATTIQKTGEWRWIIDPLDGTTNFLHRLPCYAISVGLEYQGFIVLGFIYEPNRQEFFHAIKGGGAFLNDRPIQVSKTSRLADSLLATGFPYYDFARVAGYLTVFEYFMKNTRGIRRWGAAAIDLAYVAAGRFDGFFEYGLNTWDIAAGILLVTEAGGTVSDLHGNQTYLQTGDVLVGNPQIHQAMLDIIGHKI